MRLPRLWDRRRRDQELNDEMDAHFAMAVRDRIDRGEDARQAESAVRREFGNRTLLQEETRDVWGWRLVEDGWQDVRYAFRGMRSSPIITVIAVTSLALGIGANTAIFSLVYAVMLRELPVAHPEQLVELLQKYPNEPRGNGYWSMRSYEHFRDNNDVFAAMTGAAIDNQARLQLEDSETEIVIAEYVIRNFFSELGLSPALGRLIGPEHDPAGSEGAVAVVSWSLWNRRFQGNPNVVGKKIFVDDAPVTIIGVTPREFAGLRVNAKTDLWLPAKPEMGLALLARLKSGATIEQARAEMALLYRFTIDERAAESNDPQLRNLSVEVEPAAAGLSVVRDRVGKPLSVLMAIVGVLLLLACVNVAGLLLARGASRAGELALRLGLGASRGRLMRQVLTESLMLSLLGMLAGAVIAYLGVEALLRILDSGRQHERIALDVQADGAVLLFAAGVTVLTALFFGLAPAISAFRSPEVATLRQSGRAVETRFQRLFGKGLVAVQVGLSMLLLSTGGLFLEHLANLRSADLGFRRDHVLLVGLDPSGAGYTGERLSNAYRELLGRIQAIPGVRFVSLSGPTPLHGVGASGFGSVEGFQERPEDRRWISISYVAPNYFETIGTPLLSGRGFTFQDQTNPRIAVVNQTLARHYFGDRDPIGKRITLDQVTLAREPATYEIVGVSGDANYYEIREAEQRSIYLPAFRAGGVIAGTFVIRTDVKPESIAGEVRRMVHGVAPTIPVADVATLEDQIDASIVPERLLATLSGFFAVLGALLAGIGLYGLLAYAVSRRTNEIGIRLALGATPGGVLRMILIEATAIVGVGLIFGIPMALWGRGLAGTLVPDVTTETSASFGIGVAAMLAVAFLASSIPARRAARVDPMQSLRQEWQ